MSQGVLNRRQIHCKQSILLSTIITDSLVVTVAINFNSDQMFAYFQIAPTRQCETNWHCCSCSHLATWGKNIAEHGSQIIFSDYGFEIIFWLKNRIREISEITEYDSQIIFWRDNMRAAEFLTPNIAPSDVASSPKVFLTLSAHL